MGGIDVSAGKLAILHGLYSLALAWQAVYAEKHYLSCHALILGGIIGRARGEVAMAKHYVGQGVAVEPVGHCLVNDLRGPIGIDKTVINVFPAFHHRREPPVAVDGWRRRGASCQLKHPWNVVKRTHAQQRQGVMTHGSPSFHVVAANIRRVVVAAHLAVEEHHRYAILPCPNYGRGYSHVVWRHHYEVDT